MWTTLEVLPVAGSTNAVVAERAAAGAGEGLVVVAEHQNAGRGRLDRVWVTPPRSALTLSTLVVPSGVPAGRWPWLPLLTGVAVASAVRRATGAAPALKWPNDVLLDGRKVAGILAERVERDSGAAAVLGIGVNVSVTAEDLPEAVRSGATSLLLEGLPTDRDALLRVLLEELGARYEAWRDGGGEPAGVRAAYLAVSATVGARVRLDLPAGAELVGTAVDVDDEGRLVVEHAGGRSAVAAGDVVHLRPAQGTRP